MLFMVWLVLLCLSQYCIYQTVHFKQHYWETASKILTETIFKPSTTLFLGLKQEQWGLIRPPQTTAVVQWTLYFPTWIWALLQDHSCRSCGDGEPGGEVCRWNLGVIFSKNKEVHGSVLWDHQGSSVWWAEWCCGEEGVKRRDTGHSPLRARPPASRANCPTGLLPANGGHSELEPFPRGCAHPTLHLFTGNLLSLWFGLSAAERYRPTQNSWKPLGSSSEGTTYCRG